MSDTVIDVQPYVVGGRNALDTVKLDQAFLRKTYSNIHIYPSPLLGKQALSHIV